MVDLAWCNIVAVLVPVLVWMVVLDLGAVYRGEECKRMDREIVKGAVLDMYIFSKNIRSDREVSRSSLMRSNIFLTRVW